MTRRIVQVVFVVASWTAAVILMGAFSPMMGVVAVILTVMLVAWALTDIGECQRCGAVGTVADEDTGEIIFCPSCREEWKL